MWGVEINRVYGLLEIIWYVCIQIIIIKKMHGIQIESKVRK